MIGAEKTVLAEASQAILLELARFLLQNKIGFKEFIELSRSAFVTAGREILKGENEFTLNRLQGLTGVSRGEIARAAMIPQSVESKSEKIWENAMRVLHKWHTRTEFVDKEGRPVELDLTDPDISRRLLNASETQEWNQLVAELEGAGSIEKVSNKTWKPITRYYIPKNKELMFHHFGQTVSRLISTLDRNINHSNVDAWLERGVSTADLEPDAKPLFVRVGKEQALRFIESMDDWTSSNEDDSNQEANTVGLGVYYFEDKP